MKPSPIRQYAANLSKFDVNNALAMGYMHRPLISVITANFNSGDKLAATVASVREQDVATEHLIMDGASTDGSLALARRLADAWPERLKLTSAPDRGVYDAMNAGIRLASGRYFYFLGAGDVVKPGALKTIAGYLPAHDAGMIYGDAIHYGNIYDGPFDWWKLIYQNLCHQAAFYGRDTFGLLGEFDLTYRVYADWEFNLRCFGHAKIRPTYVPVVVADYEEGGLSFDGDPRFIADREKLIRRHYGVRRYAYWRYRIFGASIKARLRRWRRSSKPE